MSSGPHTLVNFYLKQRSCQLVKQRLAPLRPTTLQDTATLI